MQHLQMIPLSKIYVPERFRKDYGNIAELAESIKQKGLIQSVTVVSNPPGSSASWRPYKLLAGGRRIKACTEAHVDDVPCIVRESAGEVDNLEIELFENIHRKDLNWQEKIQLVSRIDSLMKEKDPDWSSRKTASLLDQSVGGVSEQIQLAKAMEVIPELAECRSADEASRLFKKAQEGMIVKELRQRQKELLKTGRKMMLGVAENNYIVADTFQELVDLRTNGVVHLIEVDPPYGIELNEMKRQEGGLQPDPKITNYEEISSEDYVDFLTKLCPELYRVAGKDCWMLFWFGPSRHEAVSWSLKSAGWIIDSIPAIWTKGTGQTMQPEINLARTYEPFFICRKGNPILNKRGRSNVFDFPPTASSKKYHPTERPLPLMIELLETFSFPGQIALIPFLGSGVTLRACYLTGLKGFGFELNPDYKDNFMLAVDFDTEKLDKELEDGDDKED